MIPSSLKIVLLIAILIGIFETLRLFRHVADIRQKIREMEQQTDELNPKLRQVRFIVLFISIYSIGFFVVLLYLCVQL